MERYNVNRFKKLAGLITENQESPKEDIFTFLKNNRIELISKLKKEYNDEEEIITDDLGFEKSDIGDEVADDDQEIGFSFSFDKSKLEMGDEADQTIEPSELGGRTIYKVSYNI